MGSLSSFNCSVKYFVCVIDDVFAWDEVDKVWSMMKSIWVKPQKGKNGKIALNSFVEIVNESKRKPNKSWVDQGK